MLEPTTFGTIRQRIRRRVFTLIVLAGGVISIVASHALPPDSTFIGIRFADALSSFGDALVIAAVLAELVDRRLKTDIAREVAERTATTTSRATAEVFFKEFLGGRNLPSKYYDGMRKLAATDILSLASSWTVRLEWSPDKEYVVSETTIRNTLLNVCDKKIQLFQPWMMYLNDGRPVPLIKRYELEKYVPNPDPHEPELIVRTIYSQHELDLMNDAINDEHAQREREFPGGGLFIEPRTKVAYIATMTTYHAAASLFPIFSRFPTLYRQIQICGGALDSVKVIVKSVGKQPIVHLPGTWAHEIQFENGEFAMGGLTILVQWSPIRR